MGKILTPTQIPTVYRDTRALLLSPQGRAWCRPFLMERGKEGGDFNGIAKEMLDIMEAELRALFTQPEPIQNSVMTE